MRLLLLRHGQTTSNVAHLLDTAAPGADLTDLGRRQAEAVPGALAGERLAAIYVSHLVRTHQTAAPLARAVGVTPRERPGIAEIGAGDLEMRGDREAIDAYADVVFSWDRDPGRRVPGGESGHEVLARFDAVVAEAAAEFGDATVVFVAHGGIIRVWTALRADNVSLDYAARHWLANTAMVALDGTPETGWTMLTWCEEPLGGRDLMDAAHTGPGGEPEHEPHDD